MMDKFSYNSVTEYEVYRLKLTNKNGYKWEQQPALVE